MLISRFFHCISIGKGAKYNIKKRDLNFSSIYYPEETKKFKG